MSDPRHDLVQDIFLRAIDLPEHERTALLDERCRGDDGLRREVERLLAHDSAPAPFLDGTAAGADALARALDVPAGPLPDRIGGYDIVRLLGEGGMGAVYEATQESPRRRVALKVIRAGVVTPQILDRFRNEAHMLGRLSHPGIARVHEAGMHDDGGGARPFFAMEFIDGPDLLEYAEARGLPAEARLDLVARICDALQYAHQAGVVHRDLKPANILVRGGGDDAQPIVLDFGVARATDADLRTVTVQTTEGQLVGTVPYMSPEQASGDPNEIDARSDVYALGVIAYELLTGRLPYAVGGKMVHEAVRVIREDEPTRLSAVDASYRGDVETILGKALEKEKDRRYQSAAEFAADLRRHLAHEPITARPASTIYQLRKFARRNPALARSFVGLAAVLVIGTTTSVAFGVHARSQQGKAETAAEASDLAARKAEAVNAYLLEVLAGANPLVNPDGLDMTVPDLLDRAEASLEGSFDEQPAVEAEVRRTVGSAYMMVGRHDAALPHLDRAVELCDAAYGAVHEDTARSYRARAELHLLEGRYDDGEADARSAIAALPPDGADAELAVECRGSLAKTLHEAGRYDEARTAYDDALTLGRRTLPVDSVTMIDLRGGYASMLYVLQDFPAAEPIFAEVADAARAAHGEKHVAYVAAITNLGVVRRTMNDLDGAETCYRDSLRLSVELYGDEHPMVATATSNLGRLLQARGQFEDAEQYFVEALAMRKRLLDADHPDVLGSTRILGFFYLQWGKLEQAEALLQGARDAIVAKLGPDHMNAANATYDLTRLYLKQKRYEETLDLLAEMLVTLRKNLGDDHFVVALRVADQGLCHLRLKNYELAYEHLARAYDVVVAKRPEHGYVKRIADGMIEACDALDRPDEAARWRERAKAAAAS